MQTEMEMESISKLLFKMGIPIMLGMIFTALDSIGDAFFVGKLGVSQLSAVLICAPIGQVIVAIGLLFGNGAGAYIPRLLGAKDMVRANKVASSCLYGSLLLGLIATTLIFFNLENILRILGGTNDNISFALDYAKVYVPSLILNIFIVTMNSINSGGGQAKLVLITNSLTAILNFVLNPFCIFYFNMGIVGAAYATVIAQGIVSVVLIVNMVSKSNLFSFKISNISMRKDILIPVFKIGVSTLIFQCLTSLSSTLTNIQAKEYGDFAISGIGAATRIISLGSLMVFGFIKGFQVVAGYSYGAKRYKRLNQTIKISVIWSTAFCLFFAILLIVFPKMFISLFTTGNVDMLEIGQKTLRISGLSFIVFGFYTVYSSLFLAIGKTKKGFFLGACRQGFCFIPIIIIFPLILGINGVIYAQPVADIFSAMIAVFMAVKINKELKDQEIATTITES